MVHRVDGWEDYDVPEVLDLFSEPDRTREFFTDLARVVRAGKRVRLCFIQTRKISAECLIYLLGQIHKLQLEHGKKSLTGAYPTNRRIEHLLGESGFLDLLRVRRRAIAGRKQTGTRFLSYKSGTRLLTGEIPKLRQELFGEDFEIPVHVKREIYRALSEAMNNVGEHAYGGKQLRSARVLGRWWFGAQLSIRKNLFSMTFYDAGVGVPRTIPRSYTLEQIRGVLSMLPGISPDDGSMIKAAIAIGRTRTGKEERGKGLLDLHKLIERAGAGTLTIFSRHGWYRFDAYKRGETVGVTNGFVEGTLIRWEIPLDKAAVQVRDIYDPDDEDVKGESK